MSIQILICAVALTVVVVAMLGELWLSKRNEQLLLARGAIAPPDPAYATMRWTYPFHFVLMAAEGMLRAAGFDWFLVDGGGPGWWTWVGVVIFGLAKVLKYWAMATLGERWTYSVLVLPGAPLIAAGPYRWLRHPNYVGVVGELIGMMLIASAWISGPLAVLLFGWLLQQRIEAENRALGLDRSAAGAGSEASSRHGG